MPKYTITYFDARGKAEISRVILAYKGIEFEDRRISREDWPTMKKEIPGGLLPILTLEDGTVLSQSIAMARYLAKECELVGENNLESAQIDEAVDNIMDMFNGFTKMFIGSDEEKAKGKEQCEKAVPISLAKFENALEKNGTGYFVGKTLTWADLMYAFGLFELKREFGEAVMDNYPLLKAHQEKIFDLPAIKAYVANRKPTEF